MQISLNAQISNSNFDPSMSDHSLWQEAMSGAMSRHHHHCGDSNDSPNGQQGLSGEIQQLEQQIQSLEGQLSSLQGNGASNSSQSNSSGSSSMFGDIAQLALTAGVGMFL
jgi:TolA-binding protein